MFVTNEADWASKVMGQRESLTLDFKQSLTPKSGEEVALDIAAFANADGGVLAYGVSEGEEDGVKRAVDTQDLGPTEPLITAIEDATHTYLYGVDSRPTCVPLKLANGHRVLAVNIPPSPRLVGYFLSRERERVRYPVRVGTDRRYLRPDDVERRILSYPERAMQLRLRALLDPNQAEWPLYLLHMVPVRSGYQPDHWGSDAPAIVGLEPWGVALRFGEFRFLCPYDWILSVWQHAEWSGGQYLFFPAMLVSAWLMQNTSEGGLITAIPVPWQRHGQR